MDKSNIGAPVFIMGTQRSGTTLLTRVLSAHPDMFMQNELALPKIFTPNASKQQIIDAIKAQILDENGFSLEEVMEQGNKRVWGLKDPQLTEHIDALRQFLPESKFIKIVRDGRGVTNSYMENKWGLGTNAYYGAQRWDREVNEQLEFMQEAPENFLFIRYEDMVDDIADAMQKVCAHLDVPYLEEMVNYDQKSSYYEKKRENVHTFKKPDKKLAEKWRHRLSSFEIDVVELVAKDTLTKLGYELIGKPVKLSAWQMFYFKWHQKILGEIQIQYRWRKAAFKEKWRKMSGKRNEIPQS